MLEGPEFAQKLVAGVGAGGCYWNHLSLVSSKGPLKQYAGPGLPWRWESTLLAFMGHLPSACLRAGHCGYRKALGSLLAGAGEAKGEEAAK